MLASRYFLKKVVLAKLNAWSPDNELPEAFRPGKNKELGGLITMKKHRRCQLYFKKCILEPVRDWKEGVFVFLFELGLIRYFM